MIVIDDFNCERHLRIGVAHQVLPDAIYVFVHHRIGHQFGALLHLLGVLLAHGDFLFDRVPIPQAFIADVAIANRIHIVETALLYVIDGRNRLGLRVLWVVFRVVV